MRILARPALVAGLLLGLLTAPNSWAVEAISLAQAQRQALVDNPRLAQISARYDAALQIPSQVGSLPDPTINLGMLSVPTDTFNLDQEAMTQLQVGIVQPIPWLGKLQLAESAAQLGADATAEELEEARNLLKRDVATAWWGLFYIDKSIAVVDENLQRLREFNRIAQSRYRVGKGLQQDALQAQLELSSQLERRIVLVGQRQLVSAQFNTLLARPAEQVVTLSTPAQIVPDALPATEILIDRALDQRPSIGRQLLLVEAARERRDLADKGLYPDLTLGAAYGYRQDAPNGNSRADLFSVTLGIKIPLYAGSKQNRQIDQRGAELIAQQQALYETQLAVRSEVVQAVADYERAQAQAELLQQGVIAQAQQTVASMLSGYQVGKVDFSALVRSQLQVNRIQLQYWAAVRDAQQSMARLIAAVGGYLI